MATELITENIWQRLTSAVKKNKGKSYVAVAYFGQGGDKMLPLTKGSTLVVDASEGAVKSGQTNPHSLLELYNKGVNIYSKQGLHAKIFVIGSNLFVGSTNVSSRSSNYLTEVLFNTTESKTINDAKAFIESLADYELGYEKLKALSKIYVPPRVLGYKKSSAKKNKIIADSNIREPKFYVIHLLLENYSEAEEKHSEIANKEASKKKKNNKRHHLEEFLCEDVDEYNIQEGDIILQVTEKGNTTYITPPGIIINIHKWKKTFQYNNWKGKTINGNFIIEVPDKPRKNLLSVLPKLNDKDKKTIMRDGIKKKEFAERIISLWK